MSVVREVCRIIDVKYEILLTMIFTVVSGLYLLQKYGIERLVDTLMLWMFPASTMILITLLVLLFLGKVYLQR